MDAENKMPSGRFVLRLPPVLHGRLAATARSRSLSLNEHCVRSLAATEAGMAGTLFSGVQAAAVTQLGRQLVGVAVFGSYARGDHTADSDIDLLIVPAAEVKIERALYAPWDATPMRVGTHAVEPHFARLPIAEEPVSGFWAEVALDGAVLHDPSLVLSRTLARIRRAIIGGDLVHRSAGGHSWWSAA